MVKQLKLSACDSTQDELKRHLEDYQLVSTEKQNQGRGRGSHQWEHVSGSLAFSFSCAPHPQLTWQSLEVAVLLSEFIQQEFNARVELKWPNDLICRGKKCGGILLQHIDKKMLIGIGLNLLPNPHWGSVLSQQPKLPEDYFHLIPYRFTEFYLTQSPLPMSRIKSKWEQLCAHLEHPVRLSEGAQITIGRFTGLGEHGEALIEGMPHFNGSLDIL
jgi:BirA family biotin operon repressor/biotin-[acetyl-CoA-carboxylase] ligase